MLSVLYSSSFERTYPSATCGVSICSLVSAISRVLLFLAASKGHYEKIFSFFLVTIVGIFLLAGINMVEGGAKAWQEEASGYPTKNEYIILNYTALFRFLLLKAGVADSNFFYRWIEGISDDAYQEGIQKIPEDDAERLFWRYMCYLRPYEGGFLSREEVSDSKKLFSEAMVIVTEYPYKKAKNTLLMERYAFEQVAFAFRLGGLYAYYGEYSQEQARKEVIAVEDALERLAPSYPLYGEENKGIYGLFVMNSFGVAAGVIFYDSKAGRLTCDSPLVAAYTKLRTNFPERIKKVAPPNMIANANYSMVSKHQPKAEAFLAKECNIHF